MPFWECWGVFSAFQHFRAGVYLFGVEILGLTQDSSRPGHSKDKTPKGWQQNGGHVAWNRPLLPERCVRVRQQIHVKDPDLVAHDPEVPLQTPETPKIQRDKKVTQE